MQWKKNYPPQVDWEIDIPEKTMVDIFYEALGSSPSQIALIQNQHSITYEQFGKDVFKLANQLQKDGIKKGDRVGLMMNNSIEYVISFYAALIIGAIIVQNNTQYSKRELYYQLNNTATSTLIIDESLLSEFKDLHNETTVKKVYVHMADESVPYSLGYILKHGIPSIERAILNPKEDVAVIQFTGGTTGVSKGVMLTHFNIFSNVVQTHRYLGINMQKNKEKLLNVLPLFHVYGMTVSMNYMIYLHSTMVIMRKFSSTETLDIIHNKRISMFPGTPTIYVGVNHHPEIKKYDLTSIHTCISGSSPLPIEVKNQFEQITGAKVVDAYGLSEASPVAHSNPVNGERKPGSIGQPIPNTNCKIVSIVDGVTECGLNETGELVIKGPQVMKGYWEMPEETTNVLRDGWLYTGDLAYMDEQGYFFLVSRKKDVIISGGFNIYPREVEEVVFNHPAVKEVIAIGIPHAYRGETVKIFVVLVEGKSSTEEEIISYCHGKLAKYKLPTQVEFRDELPKTAVGKILRRTLVEEEQRKIFIK
ncbi:long-chain-fatty-acid--CoA ligase [Solibacillus sp. FSL K6-1523]|uniref:long-chain-fatty-acid--CoA ligase n=1 Tax=Solibacillus sp. FSL K6-1523 TaxID=2921471 RepID=UPI0030F750E2